MTNRERAKAILHYEKVDRVPVVAFGYWVEKNGSRKAMSPKKR